MNFVWLIRHREEELDVTLFLMGEGGRGGDERGGVKGEREGG